MIRHVVLQIIHNLMKSVTTTTSAIHKNLRSYLLGKSFLLQRGQDENKVDTRMSKMDLVGIEVVRLAALAVVVMTILNQG